MFDKTFFSNGSVDSERNLLRWRNAADLLMLLRMSVDLTGAEKHLLNTIIGHDLLINS